jgi:hypothetical protein
MNNDPRNTADDLLADESERMSYDPHNEFDAHSALVEGRNITMRFFDTCDRVFGKNVTGEKNHPYCRECGDTGYITNPVAHVFPSLEWACPECTEELH